MRELTVSEAAALLGISAVAIRKRLERGTMKGRRVTPRLYLIPEREVERWRTIGKLKPGPKPRAHGRKNQLVRDAARALAAREEGRV